ncbi:MAG: M48 family metalloprotease [Bilophila wadsworthia]
MTSQLKTFMLLALLSGLIIVLGGALGGKTGIVIAFGLALIMNVGSYWYSDKIVLRMYQARELSESEAPMIYSMVRELAANAQIPMPRIAVVPEEAPNAFATGRNPENSVVAVTEGILRLLSPEELKGVLAHEIAHIANRDILIQTVAGSWPRPSCPSPTSCSSPPSSAWAAAAKTAKEAAQPAHGHRARHPRPSRRR